MKRASNYLVDVMLLLVIGFAVYALLFAIRTNKKQRERYIYVSEVSKQYDTVKTLKTKYKLLRDTQHLLNTKYETLYIVLSGDTSCATTRRLLSMHRQLDSLGK
jgi:gas vesicle protein